MQIISLSASPLIHHLCHTNSGILNTYLIFEILDFLVSPVDVWNLSEVMLF